jgi:hypothetical protein
MPQIVQVKVGQTSVIPRLDPDEPEVGPAKLATFGADKDPAVRASLDEPVKAAPAAPRPALPAPGSGLGEAPPGAPAPSRAT